jgi:hypothetical protein
VSRIAIDPQLRGSATPSVLDRLAQAGFHVHRVGRAAYAHDDTGNRWLLVIGLAPDLIERHAEHHRYLTGRGPTPARELRRSATWARARRRLRLRNRITGRFAGSVPWWAVVDAVGRLLTPRHEQPWRLS